MKELKVLLSVVGLKITLVPQLFMTLAPLSLNSIKATEVPIVSQEDTEFKLTKVTVVLGVYEYKFTFALEGGQLW